MADQLTIPNDAVDQSVEDEHNRAMLEKIGDVEPEVPSEEDGTNEDKFGGDYAKLKESYDNLEKKLGAPREDDTQEPSNEDLSIPQDSDVPEGLDMASLTQEYTDNGGLSDKSYADLQKAGITRDVADGYIAGQKALGEQIGNEVRNSVGGTEEYSAMVDWAKSNMSPQEIQAYDSAVNSGDMNLAKMAAKGLRSDYMQAEGQEGKTYGGKSPESFESKDVFRSNAEVTAAMKDKRYEQDHAYRTDVMKKLERSDIFSAGRL
jgi:hypothetical protein